MRSSDRLGRGRRGVADSRAPCARPATLVQRFLTTSATKYSLDELDQRHDLPFRSELTNGQLGEVELLRERKRHPRMPPDPRVESVLVDAHEIDRVELVGDGASSRTSQRPERAERRSGEDKAKRVVVGQPGPRAVQTGTSPRDPRLERSSWIRVGPNTPVQSPLPVWARPPALRLAIARRSSGRRMDGYADASYRYPASISESISPGETSQLGARKPRTGSPAKLLEQLARVVDFQAGARLVEIAEREAVRHRMAGHLVSPVDHLSDDVWVTRRLLADQEKGAACPGVGEDLQRSRDARQVGRSVIRGSVEPIAFEVTRNGVDVDRDATQSTRVGGDRSLLRLGRKLVSGLECGRPGRCGFRRPGRPTNTWA